MRMIFPKLNHYIKSLSKSNKKKFCTNTQEKSEYNFVEKLIPIKNMDLNSLTKPSHLFYVREFIIGFIDMNSYKLKEAEVYFQKLKENLRETHISTHPYSLIIRRLGLVKLKQNKIKEGLIEIENFFEFSNLDGFNQEYKLNATLDLLKTYIYYDSSKAYYFANKLLKNKEFNLFMESLPKEKLAELKYYLSIAFFIEKKFPYNYIKETIHQCISESENLNEKLNYLYFLTLLHFYEIKVHNHLIDEKQKLAKNETPENSGKNLFGLQYSLEERLKRKLTKEDEEYVKLKKFELSQTELTSSKMRDDYYKKLMNMASNEYKNYEKQFCEMAMEAELTSKIKNKNILDSDNILEKSKLPKNQKINPIIHNIENFESTEAEMEKLLSEKIDFEKNFRSIIGNLFFILQAKEKLLKNSNDHLFIEYFESNIHKNSDLIDFILETPAFKEKGDKNGFRVSKELQRNDLKEILSFDYISNFNEILEFDNYFTLIRNPESLRIVIFLAELFTENSKKFKEESLFWIKYSLSLSKLFNNPDYQCRAIILACAFLIDHSNDWDQVTKILDMLNAIEGIKDNPINKAMISHLYGVIAYTDERLKGEALELIEKAKSIKSKFYSKEYLFFLNVEPIDFNSDFDEESMELCVQLFDYIEKSNKKI